MDKEEFQQKLDKLSDIDFSLPSEVEVAMDDVASYIIDNLPLKSNKLKWRTPSLFDVIQLLVEKKQLSKDASKLASKISYLLKQVYDDELNEEDTETLEELIEKLKGLLLQELPSE